MRPEDILPDAVNHTSINGLTIRKGTVAAFVANARVLLDDAAPPEARAAAESAARGALPALRALGVLEVFMPRDPRLVAWIAAQD